jgi:hypothetical protein
LIGWPLEFECNFLQGRPITTQFIALSGGTRTERSAIWLLRYFTHCRRGCHASSEAWRLGTPTIHRGRRLPSPHVTFVAKKMSKWKNAAPVPSGGTNYCERGRRKPRIFLLPQLRLVPYTTTSLKIPDSSKFSKKSFMVPVKYFILDVPRTRLHPPLYGGSLNDCCSAANAMFCSIVGP